jgi:hypothetical protein
MALDEAQKFAHETLMAELHKADDLVETHSGLVIGISGAAMGFTATQLQKPRVVTVVAIFGVLVVIEWLFKIARHRQIFRSARARLVALDAALGIDTVRPIGRINGFNILLGLAIAFLVLWVGLGLGVNLNWFDGSARSAGEAITKVSGEMPDVARSPGSRWRATTLRWDDASQSYEMVLVPDGSAEKWTVTYDAARGRITHSARQ